MERSNMSIFIMIGFSDLPDLEMTIFLFFLLSYIVTLIANLSLMTLICVSPRMKSPMYFFLCNLSGVDILCASVTSPKLMTIFLTASDRILFSECITQFFFSAVSSAAEYLILTVMSYDRYVAVCKPLHYSQTLSMNFCTISSLGIWLFVFVASLIVTGCFLFNDFCSSNIIDNFFCDFKSLTELSCRYTLVIQGVTFTESLLFLTCFLIIVTSYVFIMKSVLKIQSLQGMYKAFSTCASHLAAVTLFYLIIFILYIIPHAAITQKQRKILSVLYTNVIPIINPFIYSLRNKDVKQALRVFIQHVQMRYFVK